MAIDSSVQLNNHNSYKATEDFWQLFGIQTVEYVTISVAFYATSTQPSSPKLKVRFYGIAGTILSENTYSFAADPMWGRVAVTAQVPTGAILCHVCFLKGNASNNYHWWAEPKTEGGEIATAYSVNTAGQLTWMTASGIYTGMITASQIVLTGGDHLDNTLATFNSQLLTLTNRIGSAEADLTEITAGSASFIKASDLKTAGKTEINGGNITTGTISADRLATNSITAGKINVTNLATISANLGAITAGSININNGKFRVTTAGAVTATEATITGTLKAGSIVESSKITSNSSSSLGGTLSNAGGSVTNLTGSFNGTTGSFNGAHYGYHSGTMDSPSGTLGGIPYTSYGTSLVRLSGSVTIRQGSYLTCESVIYALGGIRETSSDIQLKKNVRDVDTLALVNDIYTLDIKEYEFIKNAGEKHIGIIANDVITDQPELGKYAVSPDPDGYLCVGFQAINTASILAIQDLNDRVIRLEERTA